MEKPTHNQHSGEFKESGNIYKYNIYTYKKPFIELTDYRTGIIDRIKNDIKTALDDLKISEWGSVYKAWRNEKIIDSFKYLTRFISALDDYYKSIFGSEIKKEMPEKIRELNFPPELENLLLTLNKIRNKMIHEDYELKEKDELIIEDAYFKLMFNLISEKLKTLNLNNIPIETDKIFIKINDIYYEIRIFLHIYLGESLGLKKFYDPFLIPLLKLLKILLE